MKPDPTPALRDIAQRRPLTEEEATRLRAWLAEHPAEREDWELERRLTRALDQCADVPLPPYFRARVMAALPEASSAAGWREWHRWFARGSLVPYAAALLVLAGFTGYSQYVSHSRKTMAHSLASVAGGLRATAHATQLPPVQVLQEFEFIDRLRQTRGLADMELLAGLDGAVHP